MAPDFLASESPIATACFRLVTFRPDPLFNFPCLKAFISRSTLLEALGPYFLVLDFFLPAVFFAVDFLALLDVLGRWVGIDFSLIHGLEAASALRVVGAQTQKRLPGARLIQIKRNLHVLWLLHRKISFSDIFYVFIALYPAHFEVKTFFCLHLTSRKIFF